MLVQFSFKNFGSFQEEAVFDMRAVNAYKEHPHKLIDTDGKTKLLRVAGIYGANASGKSNFVFAYQYFLFIVRKSMNTNNLEEDTESAISEYYDPYRFMNAYTHSNTEFEAVYIFDGMEYTYGFVYNDEEIVYEWLYRRGLGIKRKSVILERDHDSIVLGASVKKSCEKYAGEIEKDVLALTFYRRLRLRTTVFKETYQCVHSILPLWLDDQSYIWSAIGAYFVNDFSSKEKKTLLSFLKAIDSGIKDITVKKLKNDLEITTVHNGCDGQEHKAPLDIESDGTIKAIAIYAYIKTAIATDRGLLIDELGAHLHPLLTKYIIDLFYTSSGKAQLIYTTHDTTFLDKKYLRRDQIWFVAKDECSRSSMYSLAEFKLRTDASFEKSYLGGAFGAIPSLADFAFDVGGDSSGER